MVAINEVDLSYNALIHKHNIGPALFSHLCQWAHLLHFKCWPLTSRPLPKAGPPTAPCEVTATRWPACCTPTRCLRATTSAPWCPGGWTSPSSSGTFSPARWSTYSACTAARSRSSSSRRRTAAWVLLPSFVRPPHLPPRYFDAAVVTMEMTGLTFGGWTGRPSKAG